MNPRRGKTPLPFSGTLNTLGLNLVFAAAVILATLLCLRLDSLWPFSLPHELTPTAWPLLAVGLFLIVWAEAALLLFGGATGAPGDPTHRLVTSGPYRWIRNPIYLGGAAVLLGLALARQSPSLLAVAILFVPVMHILITRVEEPRAEGFFGREYIDYKQKVGRWVPRIK
jgi:protein-S-isoprenylcysteine O-methyltransferase Ste14